MVKTEAKRTAEPRGKAFPLLYVLVVFTEREYARHLAFFINLF